MRRIAKLRIEIGCAGRTLVRIQVININDVVAGNVGDDDSQSLGAERAAVRRGDRDVVAAIVVGGLVMLVSGLLPRYRRVPVA